MTPLLTELIFAGIVAALLLLLVGLQTIAKYNSAKSTSQIQAADVTFTNPGAKVIRLPQNAMKPPKERFFAKDSVSEEEMV